MFSFDRIAFLGHNNLVEEEVTIFTTLGRKCMMRILDS